MTVIEPQLAVDLPPPPGRGRWRVMLAERPFGEAIGFTRGKMLGEITDARSRRLETKRNSPARYLFTVDGDSASAALIKELAHEVHVYRWDERRGYDREMFRGVIAQSQDTLSPRVHTVNFVAHDYLAVLGRRFVTTPMNVLQTDQDILVMNLVNRGVYQTDAAGQQFGPSSRIPVQTRWCYPDGSLDRTESRVLRDRNYALGSRIGELIDNLADVINGFEYGVRPWPTPLHEFTGVDILSVYYPYRGVQRDGFALVYGSTVDSLSRAVNSAAYANYWRVTGFSDPDAPPLFAEGWNTDATDLISNPAGLWMDHEAAADVTELATLQEMVAGNLEETGLLLPAYALTLTPGLWYHDALGIGDTVNLRIASGRLDVDTWVRIHALNYAIGDDDDETVEVEVGRIPQSFVGLIRNADRRLSALERR